jgi:hypothetical protein
LLGFPKFRSSWNQVEDRSLRAPPPVLSVCELDPAVGKKPAFKFGEFIKVQRHSEVNISRVSGLRWKVYLVRNCSNEYKLRAECSAMALQDTQVSDLIVGKFGHRSGKELAFYFLGSFVRPWIRSIHQFGIDKPRRRKWERLGFPPKGDGTEGTQEDEWTGFVGKDPQPTTKLVGEGVDKDR